MNSMEVASMMQKKVVPTSGGAGIQIEGGSFSFLLPPSFFFFSSSSSFILPLLHSCLKNVGGLHGFYGSRGAGAPPAPPGSATAYTTSEHEGLQGTDVTVAAAKLV